VKVRELPANPLDQLQPEKIELDGSDGPHGDNVIDEAAEFRFMRSNVITLWHPCHDYL
jgi:hypothetical protein